MHILFIKQGLSLRNPPPYRIHFLAVCLDWLGLNILKTVFAKEDLSKKEYEDIDISNRDIL